MPCGTSPAGTTEETLDLSGAPGLCARRSCEAAKPLLLVDMRSPSVLLQNIPTTLKEPFSSDPAVLAAVRNAHRRIQRALCTGMYPGTLILSLNAEVIYHRLVRKITELQRRPAPEPTGAPGPGPQDVRALRQDPPGQRHPQHRHQDHPHRQGLCPGPASFAIEGFPGYAPLESQIRTIHSFRRPVILVDDLLHSGNRIRRPGPPLPARRGVEIDQVLVGLLSGRGRDLMAAKGRSVDCVYFVPNLRAWFVESTMYPFIGGDTVGRDRALRPGSDARR